MISASYRSMSRYVISFVLLLSTASAADTLTRTQFDALVDGARATTRALLNSCTDPDDFVSCTRASGIRCEKVEEETAQDYRCVTYTAVRVAIEKAGPSAVSETLEVTYRAIYANDKWSIGPQSIGRVVN